LVNVRAEPTASGAVLAQLRVNTPVQASSAATQQGFCEIAWGDSQHGFVSCPLLGDRVLTLQEVGSEYLLDGRTPNPNYSATRAFWIEPGLEWLLASGRYFESRFLTAEQQAAEQQFEGDWDARPEPQRFPIPEFEAMKTLMRNGVVGAVSNLEPMRRITQSPTLASWSKVKAVAKAGNPSDNSSMYNELRGLHPTWGLRDPSVALLQKMELPKVRSSLFKNESEIGRPLAKTEEISAKFSIPYQAKVLTGPQWIPDGHYNTAYVFGAWDAGAIETRLAREVYKHTIYASGKIVSERTVVKGGEYPPSDADNSECNIGFSLGDANPQVWKALGAGYSAPPKESARGLFYFYSKGPLPYAHAKVSKQMYEIFVDGFIGSTTRHFDIDSDGATDLLMWEGTGISKQEIHDPNEYLPHYRMMFININAEWYLLAVDEFLYGCGC
jgi:hypothetical protein